MSPFRPCAVLASLLVPVPAQDARPPEAAPLEARVRALVERAFTAERLVGVACGARLGEQVVTLGLGTTRAADGATPGPDTIFEIGSVTKVFTGVLLADLARREVVDPTAPVAGVLPEGWTVPTGGDRPVTFVDLTTHRSGLPRMPHNFRPADGANPYVDYRAEDLAEFLADCRPQRAPGEAYAYSNVGVGLLGYALGRAAGEPWPELVEERVLRPLALTSTTVHGVADPARAATGHDALGRPTAHWDFDVLAPAGALRSTVHDLLRFAAAHFADGAEGELGAALGDACVTRSSGEGPETGYGWHVTVRPAGARVLWHNGGTGGFASFLAVEPERRLAVAVLTNSARSVDGVGIALVDALLSESAK